MKCIQILSDNQKKECVNVLRSSFETVAKQFGLTSENAPTNPAFITEESLSEYINKNPFIYGYYIDNIQAGCIAIEKSKTDDSIYFIERLAVIPEKRHLGIGKQLLDFAINEIRQRKGLTAGIGIIDKNTLLKNWYIKYGFAETGKKEFPHLPFTVCFMEYKIK